MAPVSVSVGAGNPFARTVKLNPDPTVAVALVPVTIAGAEVTVSTTGAGWLLEVLDAAGDTPPTPAVDRDAALGGLGLYLVARLSSAHGWAPTHSGRKAVWALVGFDGVALSTEDTNAASRSEG